MKAGEFENGERVLRAKIDMASPNLVMRDPILYRVHKVPAPPHRRRPGASTRCTTSRTASPTRSRAITHSLCTLEFVDHRALYDWILDALEVDCHPQQIEFARGNLSHTVMSKRVLRELVEDGHVRGWDDPRMPTLSGMRRRGYPPAAIRRFWDGDRRRQARQPDPARAPRARDARGAEPHRAARDGGAAARCAS